MTKLADTVHLIVQINWIKTFLFNFYYFSPKVAMRFPAFIYRRTVFNNMGGRITLCGAIRTGMLRVGAPEIGMQDFRYSRTVWQVRGGVFIHGQTIIGRGCRISVNDNAELILGDNFVVNGDLELVCNKQIRIGNDCLLSWGCLIMDTDFHTISTLYGNDALNPDSSIMIGDHVWIGCRCTILKGAAIPTNSVIAANSTITKKLYENNVIYGGHGQSVAILKKSIEWHL